MFLFCEDNKSLKQRQHILPNMGKIGLSSPKDGLSRQSSAAKKRAGTEEERNVKVLGMFYVYILCVCFMWRYA